MTAPADRVQAFGRVLVLDDLRCALLRREQQWCRRGMTLAAKAVRRQRVAIMREMRALAGAWDLPAIVWWGLDENDDDHPEAT